MAYAFFQGQHEPPQTFKHGYGCIRNRVLFLSLFFICFSVGMLSASASNHTRPVSEPLYLTISDSENNHVEYRYQINGEDPTKWESLPDDTHTLALLDFDPREDKLFIQMSTDGEQWSYSYPFKFDEIAGIWISESTHQAIFEGNKISWRRSASFDILPSFEIPSAQCEKVYDRSIGGVVRINLSSVISPKERIILNMETGYRYNRSVTSWVSHFHDFTFLVGSGYSFPINTWVSLEPTVSIGMVAHYLIGDIDGDGMPSNTLFTDPKAQLTLTCVVGKEHTPLLLLSPHISWYFEKSHIGQHTGIDVGLRLGW